MSERGVRLSLESYPVGEGTLQDQVQKLLDYVNGHDLTAVVLVMGPGHKQNTIVGNFGPEQTGEVLRGIALLISNKSEEEYVRGKGGVN